MSEAESPKGDSTDILLTKMEGGKVEGFLMVIRLKPED